jgi:formate dehydrogenase subunit gamma
MAAISPDERPAFFSMFTGTVPEDYAEHHHKLWYDEVKTAERKAVS